MTDKEIKDKIMTQMFNDLGFITTLSEDNVPYWAIELVDSLVRKGWRKP